MSAVASVFDDEFIYVISRLWCRDKAVWDRLHILARDSNDPLSQAALAIGYFKGFFVKDVDLSLGFANQCVSWLRSQTDRHSYFCLGKFYEEGISVAADKNEAVRYFRLGAEFGSELCHSNLGLHFEKDKNFAEAAKWYRLAAEAGYCVAQCNLGNCYRSGWGVTQDFQRAVHWYRLAADQGYCNAQYELGLGYHEGVDADYIEAVQWCQLAADLRYPKAQNLMGICFELGHGVTKNATEMIKWYRLAADQNDEFAQCNLGVCYERGHGVRKDIDEAIRLYTLASERGHERSKQRLNAVRS